MSRVRNSEIATLIEWLCLTFATIIKLVRDGKRSEEDLAPLKTTMQAVIGGKSFQVVFEPSSKSFKDLATSLDPVGIHSAWVQLYAKWSIQHSVPEVPFTAKQIRAKKDHGRVLIYLAPELSSTEALAELGKLFPRMQSWSVSGDDNAKKIKNVTDLSGWLFVEQALNMPNPNTTEDGLRKIFSQQNAKGMTVNTYIIFGQFCKEVFGKYPDIPGYVRLLGSSFDGGVLIASFRQDGRLHDVSHYWSPDNHDSIMGGRSVAV